MAAASATEKTYPCPFCDKLCNSRSALSKHKRSKHPNEDKIILVPTTTGGKLKCGLCELSLGTRLHLCTHLEEIHETPAQVLQRTFQNEEEFDEWLRNEAEQGCFEWTRAYGKKLADGQRATLGVRCHRSGAYTSQSTDQRAPRSRGTIKVGYECSAFVNSSADRNTGEVIANFCLDHYGHDFPLAALHIPEETRQFIADHIQDGRDSEYILQKIQESAAGGIWSKHHLTRPQDIRNIAEQMGLKVHQRAKMDEISVDILVRQMQEERGDETPVFYYKPVQEDGSFAIGIQTPFQREMCRTLGNKGICVDSTHKSTQYPFLLTTVLVVDDHAKGCPVASLVTHSESCEALTPFFEGIRDRVGMLTPEIFMSDDANAFWNAWKNVFEIDNTDQWHCTWHTVKNFKGNARSGDNAIKDKELREMAIQTTRDMVYAKSKEEFSLLSTRLLTALKDNGEMPYYNYLQKYLTIERQRLWALYLRSEQLMNANMFLESYHNVLKGEGGLKRKQNRRLDYLIDVLLKLSDRYCFQYVQQSIDPKVAGYKRKRNLHHRHQGYLRMVEKGMAASEEVIEDQEWLVSSEAKEGELTHRVTVRDPNCGCNLRCNWCKVCPDNYTCTCDDYLTYGRASACKHIHLISAQQQPEGTAVGIRDISVVQQRPTIGPGVAAATLLPQPPQQNAVDTTSLRAEWQKIGEMIEQIKSPEALKTFTEKVKQVRHLATSLIEREAGEAPTARFEVTQKVHGAQNAEKQLRFPKRKKRQTPRAAKMTTADLHKMLEGVTEDHCAHCFRDNDNTDCEFRTQCDTCDLWFHDNCIEKTDDSFQCSICVKKKRQSRAESKATQEGEQPKRRRQQSPDHRPDSAGAGPSGPRRYHKVLRTDEVQSSSNVSAPQGNLVLRLRSGNKVMYLRLRCDGASDSVPQDELSEEQSTARINLQSELQTAIEKIQLKYANDAVASIVQPHAETDPEAQLGDVLPEPELKADISGEPLNSKGQITVEPKPNRFPLCDRPQRLRVQLGAYVKSTSYLQKRTLYGPADQTALDQQIELLAVAHKRVLLANVDRVRTKWPWKIGLGGLKRSGKVEKAERILVAVDYFKDTAKEQIVQTRAMSTEVLYDPTGLWTGEKLRKRRYGAYDDVLPSDHLRTQRKQEQILRATPERSCCQKQDEEVTWDIKKKPPTDVADTEQCTKGWFWTEEGEDTKREQKDQVWSTWRNEEDNQVNEKREREQQDATDRAEKERRDAEVQTRVTETKEREERERRERVEERERNERARNAREQQERETNASRDTEMRWAGRQGVQSRAERQPLRVAAPQLQVDENNNQIMPGGWGGK